MIRTTRIKLLAAVVGLASISIVGAQAQVNLSSGLTYSQNFNTLAAATTEASTNFFTNNVTLLGWYINSTSTTGGTVGTSNTRGSNGNSSGAAGYDYGAYGDADRAFGLLNGSGDVRAFGARFTNDTATTFSSIDLGFTGEQWRITTNSKTLFFDYAITTSATPFANTDPFNATFTWTNVPALNFTSPSSAAAASASDGNNATNRVVFGTTNIALTLNPGDEVLLRWKGTQSHGAGLAVDDLSVTFNPVPEPATVAMLAGGVGLLGILRRRRNRH